MTESPGLVDTNILCYAFDNRDTRKQKAASGLLSRCWQSEISLAVSIQNLAEFSVVMTEKIENPVSNEVITRFIRDISLFEGWKVLCYDSESIIDAVNISSKYSLHFWDSLLAATMKFNGLELIYSEDSHFKRVPWLTVINPFIS